MPPEQSSSAAENMGAAMRRNEDPMADFHVALRRFQEMSGAADAQLVEVSQQRMEQIIAENIAILRNSTSTSLPKPTPPATERPSDSGITIRRIDSVKDDDALPGSDSERAPKWIVQHSDTDSGVTLVASDSGITIPRRLLDSDATVDLDEYADVVLNEDGEAEWESLSAAAHGACIRDEDGTIRIRIRDEDQLQEVAEFLEEHPKLREKTRLHPVNEEMGDAILARLGGHKMMTFGKKWMLKKEDSLDPKKAADGEKTWQSLSVQEKKVNERLQALRDRISIPDEAVFKQPLRVMITSLDGWNTANVQELLTIRELGLRQGIDVHIKFEQEKVHQGFREMMQPVASPARSSIPHQSGNGSAPHSKVPKRPQPAPARRVTASTRSPARRPEAPKVSRPVPQTVPSSPSLFERVKGGVGSAWNRLFLRR